MGNSAPKTVGGSPVSIIVYVEEVDATATAGSRWSAPRRAAADS
jgi:hypothetical protein